MPKRHHDFAAGSAARSVMHTDTDTVDIDDIDAALDASADDKEQDAAPTFAELGVPKPLVHVLAMDGKVTAFRFRRTRSPIR